jgi:uncharacterized protein YjbI with pentapeptide repeats
VTALKNISKKKPPTTREVPDLSPDLQPYAGAATAFSEPEIIIRDCVIENLSFDHLSPQSILFENCILTRISINRNKLHGFKLKDVRLVGCDFANLEAAALKILRVEFLNCRLTGLRAVETECQHCLISEGDASYSQFRFGNFKFTEFNSCNLSESDFQSSDLRGVLLKNCNLTKAEMTGAKLREADFRGSRVDGLMANAEDLKGAIVDPAQALVFAELMGIKIR